MKKHPRPDDIMELLSKNLNKAYLNQAKRFDGVIQFYLTHNSHDIDCHFKISQNGVFFSKGISDIINVTVKASLYDWLDLAGGRLNPVLGVLTKKIKFTGDTSFLRKFIEVCKFEIEIDNFNDPVTGFEKNPQKYWKKPKKILVINASPRNERGYTYFYLQPFIKGLCLAGASCEIIHLYKLKINRCTGCWHCWLSGTGNCIFNGKDDFKEVQQKYENSDLVVFAFPLYTDGMPSVLKDFWERMVSSNYPYMIEGIYKTRHPRRHKKQRSAVIFATSGFMEIENFDAVLSHFRQISHNDHLPIIAEILRPAGMYLYNNPLLYKKLNNIIDALEKAGAEVFEFGKVFKKTQQIISQQVDSVENFRLRSNFFWSEKIKEGEKIY